MMIFSMTYMSAMSRELGKQAHIDLPRLIPLDLLGVPYFLICLTCLEVDVILQCKLDQ